MWPCPWTPRIRCSNKQRTLGYQFYIQNQSNVIDNVRMRAHSSLYQESGNACDSGETTTTYYARPRYEVWGLVDAPTRATVVRFHWISPICFWVIWNIQVIPIRWWLAFVVTSFLQIAYLVFIFNFLFTFITFRCDVVRFCCGLWNIFKWGENQNWYLLNLYESIFPITRYFNAERWWIETWKKINPTQNRKTFESLYVRIFFQDIYKKCNVRNTETNVLLKHTHEIICILILFKLSKHVCGLILCSLANVIYHLYLKLTSDIWIYLKSINLINDLQ